MGSSNQKQYSKNEIIHHLKKQQESNLNITAYCKKYSIAYSTFTYWKKCSKKKMPSFVQIQVPTAKQNTLEIKLPNGIQVKVESASQMELIEKLMQVTYAQS